MRASSSRRCASCRRAGGRRAVYRPFSTCGPSHDERRTPDRPRRPQRRSLTARRLAVLPRRQHGERLEGKGPLEWCRPRVSVVALRLGSNGRWQVTQTYGGNERYAWQYVVSHGKVVAETDGGSPG